MHSIHPGRGATRTTVTAERLLTVYGNGFAAPATYYAWEGGQVIADFRAGMSSNLVWEKNYVYLGGRLLATTDINGTKYHHPDRLGTRLVTDGADGMVTTEQVNLPYGTALATESSGGLNNRRFTSYDRSAGTGMDYAVNRFYNPAQGRFNQVDPIGMGAVSLEYPQTLNLYSYCGNDPINHVDPDGLLFGWVGKLFKGIRKFFSNVWVKIAVIVALIVISYGLLGPLTTQATLGTISGTGAQIGGAVKLTAVGWLKVGLQIASGVSLVSWDGWGFRTPSINPGAIEQYFNKGGKGTGGGGKGSGGGGKVPYNYPPRTRTEAWLRIYRDILYGRRVAPPPRQVQPIIPSGSVKHHIFPQQQSLAREFQARGIDIHSSTIWIPSSLHRTLHGGGGYGGAWNRAWRDFFIANPNATTAQVAGQAMTMIRNFGLTGYPMVTYK